MQLQLLYPQSLAEKDPALSYRVVISVRLHQVLASTPESRTAYCDLVSLSQLYFKSRITHKAHPSLPLTPKPHPPPSPRPLHPETNIYASMQLIYLATNPRYLTREVYLIAQYFSGFTVGA